jgi:hypothetical protein
MATAVGSYALDEFGLFGSKLFLILFLRFTTAVYRLCCGAVDSPPKEEPMHGLWRQSVQALLLVIFLILGGWPTPAHAAEITVSTAVELANTVGNSAADDTILLEDGKYALSGSGTIVVRTHGLTIRSKRGDRSAVVVEGWGMQAGGHNGFWVAADDVTIADLTIQNVGYHCIQTDVDVDRLTVRNCILRDAGEQLLKVPTTAGADHADNGLVEGCLFEYSAGVGPQFYIGGIDVHHGKGWIVRDNQFRSIRSPDDRIAEHAIHFWNDSRDTLVERNWIFDCDRGIGFGLGTSTHTGGIVRNNMIAHDAASLPDGSAGHNDVGIGLESAPGAQVYNNTVFFMHSYNAIEYRFSATTGVYIANNLVNRAIQQRDGATATLTANVIDARDDWFVDAQGGDLHLRLAAPEVVDQAAAIGELTDDFDQDPRPQGTGIDIGADEMVDCLVDQNTDGDVDGEDLALAAANLNPACLSKIAAQFGK